jgi:hypothetical protein
MQHTDYQSNHSPVLCHLETKGFLREVVSRKASFVHDIMGHKEEDSSALKSDGYLSIRSTLRPSFCFRYWTLCEWQGCNLAPPESFQHPNAHHAYSACSTLVTFFSSSTSFPDTFAPAPSNRRAISSSVGPFVSMNRNHIQKHSITRIAMYTK